MSAGTSPVTLIRGSVALANLDPALGRDQAGHRPTLVVSSDLYLDTVATLAIVAPVTTVDRGWPNHIRLDDGAGLDQPSWAMVEQPRTLTRARITSVIGWRTGRRWPVSMSTCGISSGSEAVHSHDSSFRVPQMTSRG